MSTYKCTFRGRVGTRDEVRAEVYMVMPQNSITGIVSRGDKPGYALDMSEPIVLRHIPNLLIKGRSVRKVADVERTMIRVFRFHRVLEGEVQDNGTLSPIAPLTISVEAEDGDDVEQSVDPAELHLDASPRTAELLRNA